MRNYLFITNAEKHGETIGIFSIVAAECIENAFQLVVGILYGSGYNRVTLPMITSMLRGQTFATPLTAEGKEDITYWETGELNLEEYLKEWQLLSNDAFMLVDQPHAPTETVSILFDTP